MVKGVSFNQPDYPADNHGISDGVEQNPAPLFQGGSNGENVQPPSFKPQSLDYSCFGKTVKIQIAGKTVNQN